MAGAHRARGVAIVIDVFRACSLVAHAFAAGARRIIPVAAIETALQLKRLHPDALLVGERHGHPLPGFDCGNSPHEVLRQPLRGRTLVHTTHAGTQGIAAAAARVEAVFTGAFVNAAATVAAVQALRPDVVSVIAMGQAAESPCIEDSLCQCLFAARLAGQDFDTSTLAAQLRAAPAAAKFFDPQAHWAPQEDFALCAQLDTIDCAARLVRSPGEPDALHALRG